MLLAAAVIDVVQVVLVAAIAATPPTIAALAAYRKGVKNSKALEAVHLSVNGRLHELLEATKKLGKIEGYREAIQAKRGSDGSKKGRRKSDKKR